MAFNVKQAKAAGYSDTEIADYLSQQRGFNIQGARDAGYQDYEITNHLIGLQQEDDRPINQVKKAANSAIDFIRNGLSSVNFDPVAVAQQRELEKSRSVMSSSDGQQAPQPATTPLVKQPSPSATMQQVMSAPPALDKDIAAERDRMAVEDFKQRGWVDEEGKTTGAGMVAKTLAERGTGMGQAIAFTGLPGTDEAALQRNEEIAQQLNERKPSDDTLGTAAYSFANGEFDRGLDYLKQNAAAGAVDATISTFGIFLKPLRAPIVLTQGASEGGNTYRASVESGMSEEAALGRGAFQALTASLTEMVGFAGADYLLGKLTKMAPKAQASMIRKAMASAGKAAGTAGAVSFDEGAEEVINSIANDLADKYGFSRLDMSEDARARMQDPDILGNASESFVAGALGGAVSSPVAAGASVLQDAHTQRAEQAVNYTLNTDQHQKLDDDELQQLRTVADLVNQEKPGAVDIAKVDAEIERRANLPTLTKAAEAAQRGIERTPVAPEALDASDIVGDENADQLEGNADLVADPVAAGGNLGEGSMADLAVQPDGAGLGDPAAEPVQRSDANQPAVGTLPEDVALAEPAPVDVSAHDAATSPVNDLPEPTDAQKEAGNYKKGAINVGGLNISVENPEGSVRRSKADAVDKWETTMTAHYGYVKGVKARAPDKEHVDVYVKPGTHDGFSGDVYVVNQVDPKTGKFDEPKAMIGYDSQDEAEAGYRSNYTPDWNGMGSVARVPMERFKEMLQDEKAFLKPIEHLQSLNKKPDTAAGVTGGTAARPQLRPLIEALIKRRAAANQVGKSRQLQTMLDKAKAAMNGEDIKPAVFKNGAVHFNKVDEDTRGLLLKIHDAIKNAPNQAEEERQAKAQFERAERARRQIAERNKLNPKVDDLLTAIAKLGGVKKDEAISEFGFDPADLGRFRSGIKPAFSNGKNALTVDGMREALNQYGYPVGETVRDFGDILDAAIRGGDVQTDEGIERDIQARIEAYEEQFADQPDAVHEAVETALDDDLDSIGSVMTDDDVEALFNGPSENQQEGRREDQQVASGTTEGGNRNGEATRPDQASRAESQQDLLGDNTAGRQAVADAARAKDEKRNSGESSPEDFTLTGSDRAADQAAARGAQNLFDQPKSSAEKAAETRARRQSILAVLGDGWKASDGDGAKDIFKKRLGRLEVSVQPEKTVDGNFTIGAYRHGGDRPGIAGQWFADTLDHAAEIANGVFEREPGTQWDAMPNAQRKRVLAKYFGPGTDGPERYADRKWDSFNVGEKSSLRSAMDQFGPNDRDHFTLERMNRETGKMEPEIFKRGESVKVAGSFPMSTGTIDGISQADRQAKVGHVWYDFGYIYKADYDEYESIHDEITKTLNTVASRLDDGNSIDAQDMLRDAENQAKDRGVADQYLDRIQELRSKAIDVSNKAQAEYEARQTEADSKAEAQRQKEREEAARQPEPVVRMTMDEWKATHKDFKGTINGQRTVLRNGRMVNVEIIKPQPEETPQQSTPLAPFDNAMDEYRNGTANVDDYKAAFKYVLDHEKEITDYLDTLTKKQLFERGDYSLEARYKNEKKERVVRALYGDMVSDFLLPGESGMTSYSHSYGQDRYENIKKQVDAITQESLNKAMQRRQEAIEANTAKKAEVLKGISDPQTLDDFNNLMRSKMADGMTLADARKTLTPEQRERYDDMAATKTRGDRGTRKNEQKTEVRAAVHTTTGDIIETKHTKTGEDLFVVKAAERVDRDVYNQWNATAKRLGGWYSSFRGNGAVPGFQFKTRENAEAFLKYLGGDVDQAKEAIQTRRDEFADDRSQTAVQRLTEMADKLEERADDSLGQERKANTARRARFAASAEAAANADKALAKTMRNIAQGIDAGSVKYLDQVRQKVQVEMLQGIVRTANDELLRDRYKSYREQEEHKHDRPTKEAADYVQFPSYTAYRSDLASLGRALLDTEGTKKIGQRVMSVADDVTDAYLKFARENLYKVSRYSVNGGEPAVFPNKQEAEKVIARSGFNGKAIVLPFKRGQNMIILSPSEAMNLNLWKGDHDKRITLAADLGAEIVEKLGKINRNRSIINAPWQFENAYDKRKRLAAMGIETPAELRAAVREFIGLQEAPQAPDRVKELERAMIGRRNDGLDFFPTPASVADQMIETAGLTDNMRVLEPSAGMGHIADQIRQAGVEPDVVEFSGDRRELLQAKGYNVVGHDFMDVTDGDYDRIIMNPPFGDRRDAAHVQHAYSLLKPGGRLVAIMGEGVFFGQDKRAQEFREWLEQVGGTDEKLEEGTFNDPSLPVNTGANARMVVINKAEDAPAFSRTPERVLFRPQMHEGFTKKLSEHVAAFNSGDRRRMQQAGNEPIPISRTPVVLRQLLEENGSKPFKQSEFVVGQGSTLYLKANNIHSRSIHSGKIGIDVLNRLPELLADPVAVFKSSPAGEDARSFKVLIDAADEGGNPVVVAIKPNVAMQQLNDANVHLQATIFPTTWDHVRAWNKDGLLRYYNDKSPRASVAASSPREAGSESPEHTQGGLKLHQGADGFDATIGAQASKVKVMTRSEVEGLPPAAWSRGAGRGMNRDMVQSVIDDLKAKWQNAPEVVVVDDMNDARIRKAVRDENDRQLSQGASGQPEGFFDAGKVFIVASEMNSSRDVQRVLFHEALGHYGLRGVFGPVLDDILDQIYMTRRSDVLAKAKAYGLDVSKKGDRRIAAEEVLAEMAQNNPQLGFVQRAIAAIRSWLRKAGFDINLTDAEIIREFIEPARAFVQRGEQSGIAGDIVAAFDRGSGDQTETEAFKRWFGDSKVVDAEGKPLVVYHGTRHQFDVFKPSKPRNAFGNPPGIYFTDDKSEAKQFAEDVDGATDERSRVVSAYVSIRAPYITEPGERLDPTEANRIAASGEYDGIIRRRRDGTTEYIAFRPEQIKSAIGNNGDFDPENPNIVFSRAGSTYWEGPEESKLDNLIYTLQDKNIDLKRVTARIQDVAGQLEDRWDAYLQEELYHGRAAKRTKDFINEELEPLIEDMRKRGVSMTAFEEYLWARHAEERNIQIAKINPELPDGGSGMTTQEARDYLAGLKPIDRKNYEALAQRVDAITRKSRQVLVDYGLESEDTIKAWGEAYENYVPLMREDMDHGFAGGTGQGFSVKGSASKRATGSTRKVVDILANIAQQRERNIIRGEKNRVATALIGLAKLNPNPDYWKTDSVPKVRTVTPGKASYEVHYHGSKVNEFSSQAAADKFIEYEGKPGYEVKRVQVGEQVEDRPDPNYKNRPNVIVARIVDKKGQVVEHSIVFDEREPRAMRMAASLKNLDQDQIGEVLGAASVVTRYFASINTQYNPIFGIINILRDSQGAVLNLTSTELAGKQKEVIAATLPAMRGIYKDVRGRRKKATAADNEWAMLWEEFQKEGGQTGYRDMFRNARERAENLEHALDPTWWQKRTWGKVVSANGLLAAPEQWLVSKPGKAVFDWLSDYNETLENAVRLAAYKVGIENGMTKQRAASLAKNLTVNFNRKGEMGRQIGALYAFFNASVQGTARIAQTLAGPAGKQIVAGGLLLGVMQAVALALAGFDDDEPPDWERDRNLIIPIGDGKYLKFAMPLGFNAIPAFGRIATEWALDGFTKGPQRLVHTIDMLLDVTNPIGNAGFSMQTVSPTALDPIAALTENKDWTGRPIAREDMSSLNPTPGHTRAKDTASAFGKSISRAINYLTGGTDFKPGAVSPTPDQVDYLIGQIAGGVGREYLKAEQTATSAVTGESLPVYKIPLFGRFYGDTTGQSSQASEFYNNLRELNEHENEIKGRRKAGEDVLAYRRENPETGLIPFANMAERQVQALRKRKRELVEKDAPKEKIAKVDERITAIMTRMNERVKARKEASE